MKNELPVLTNQEKIFFANEMAKELKNEKEHSLIMIALSSSVVCLAVMSIFGSPVFWIPTLIGAGFETLFQITFSKYMNVLTKHNSGGKITYKEYKALKKSKELLAWKSLENVKEYAYTPEISHQQETTLNQDCNILTKTKTTDLEK